MTLAEPRITNIDFQYWVASLALIKVSERPVEGLHARVSRVMKRAPNANMALISSELRFSSFCTLLLSNPQAGIYHICLIPLSAKSKCKDRLFVQH